MVVRLGAVVCHPINWQVLPKKCSFSLAVAGWLLARDECFNHLGAPPTFAFLFVFSLRPLGV